MIDDINARYLIAHGTLHALWSACVGEPGYDKAYWRDLDNALAHRFGSEMRAAGRKGPLLP